jgi:hypothetical protein
LEGIWVDTRIPLLVFTQVVHTDEKGMLIKFSTSKINLKSSPQLLSTLVHEFNVAAQEG